VVATFTAADSTAVAADFTASITWGDGSDTVSGTVSLAGDHFAVTAPAHTYVGDGGYRLDVTITRNAINGAAIAAYMTKTRTTVEVADAAVTAWGAGPYSGTAGVSLGTVSVASFSDAFAGEPTSEYTALVNWGDGTAVESDTVVSSAGTFWVQGTHAYAHPGQFTARILILDDSVVRAITTTQVNISPTTP